MNSLRRRLAGLGAAAALCGAISARAQPADLPSLEVLLAQPVREISSVSRHAQDPKDAPSAVTIIGADEIRAFGWRTLADALSSIRGVYATNDRAYVHLGVRGFGRPGDYNARILLLLNGTPVNDGLYDQAPVGTDLLLDMDLVERIEFSPGAGSVMYGGNALFAVVNVVTRIEPGPSVVAGTVGTAGEFAGALQLRGRSAAGSDWVAAFQRYQRQGETLVFPAYAGSGFDPVSAGMDRDETHSAYLRLDRGGLSMDLQAGQRIKRTPGGPYGADLNDPRNRYDDQRAQLGIRYARPLDIDWRLSGQVYGQWYTSNGDAVFAGVFERDGLRSWFYGGDAVLSGPLGAGNHVTVGVAARSDLERRQFNPSPQDTDNPRHNVAAFVQDDWRLGERLQLSAGLRQDRNSEGFGERSHRLALIYEDRRGGLIKLIHGSAFRPPNAFERYYMYQGFNDPNPDLVPERLRSAELVVEQRFGRGWIAGSLFRNRIDDLIVLQTDAASGIQKHFNLGQAEMRGLELEAGLTGGAGSLRANLTWQRALFREPGVSAELPNAPRVLANLLASTPQQRVFGVPLRWGAEFKYLGSRLSDPGDARVAGDRVGSDWWANLTATAAPTRTLEVQLQISNVFDRSIEHVVGTEYDESFPALMNARMPTLVQDGRSARVTGRWNF